jgi:hypothetical protein
MSLTSRSRLYDDYDSARGISLSTRNIGTDYDVDISSDGMETSQKDFDSPRGRYSDHGEDGGSENEDDGDESKTENESDNIEDDIRYK